MKDIAAMIDFWDNFNENLYFKILGIKNNKIMEAIKFRALKDDMSNCTFVYGQLVYDAFNVPRITVVDFSEMGLTFHTCIKNTESQALGIYDKNGKEYYFDDIVEMNGSFGVLVWMEDRLGIGSGTPNNYHAIDSITKRELENSTIIGNIHENKELL